MARLGRGKMRGRGEARPQAELGVSERTKRERLSSTQEIMGMVSPRSSSTSGCPRWKNLRWGRGSFSASSRRTVRRLRTLMTAVLSRARRRARLLPRLLLRSAGGDAGPDDGGPEGGDGGGGGRPARRVAGDGGAALLGAAE